MKRKVIHVTLVDDAGTVLHREIRAALNAGIRASEAAVREIARKEQTSYEGERPVRVGDVYTRRWVSKGGRAIVATIEKEQSGTSRDPAYYGRGRRGARAAEPRETWPKKAADANKWVAVAGPVPEDVWGNSKTVKDLVWGPEGAYKILREYKDGSYYLMEAGSGGGWIFSPAIHTEGEGGRDPSPKKCSHCGGGAFYGEHYPQCPKSIKAKHKPSKGGYGVFVFAEWYGDAVREQPERGYVDRPMDGVGVPYSRMTPIRVFKSRALAKKLADKMTFGEAGRDPSSVALVPTGGATAARTLTQYKHETEALLTVKGAPRAKAKSLVRAHTADVKRAWKRRQPPCAATDTIVREEKAGMHGKRDPASFKQGGTPIAISIGRNPERVMSEWTSLSGKVVVVKSFHEPPQYIVFEKRDAFGWWKDRSHSSLDAAIKRAIVVDRSHRGGTARDPEKCEAFADMGEEVRLTKKPRDRHAARTIAKSIGRTRGVSTYLQCPSGVVDVHVPKGTLRWKELHGVRGGGGLSPRGKLALAGLGAVAVLAAVGDPGHPKPKFKLGDSVVRDDGMKGVVSFIGAYDDFLKQYRYKVQEESGARLHWNENTMRKISKRDPSSSRRMTDGAVLNAFIDHRPGESKKLSTDGHRLDGNWMGGRGIAEWVNGKIVMNDLGSRAAQKYQRALYVATPKNWFASTAKAKRDPKSNPFEVGMRDPGKTKPRERWTALHGMPQDERTRWYRRVGDTLFQESRLSIEEVGVLLNQNERALEKARRVQKWSPEKAAHWLWVDVWTPQHAEHGLRVRGKISHGSRDPAGGTKADGKRYADEQLESSHFRDWVFDQVYEAKRHPESHWQIESKADAIRAAKNMLKQLEWDTARDLHKSREFFEGFREVLNRESTRRWLADEILYMVQGE